MPPSPFSLLALLFLLGLVLALVQLGLISLALEKLGLDPASAGLLLMISLAGSMVNLPLIRIRNEHSEGSEQLPEALRRVWRIPPRLIPGETRVMLNVGGGLVPLMFSSYLVGMHGLPLGDVLLGVAIISAVSYGFSRPMPGIGIGMPILVAPVSAAFTALLLNPEQSAPLAYVCGTMGVLVGADLLRLKDIRQLHTPLAAIGGAGTFDGIFITGLVAVLLA